MSTAEGTMPTADPSDSMILHSHESRIQAMERILSGLGEHRAAIDAHLRQLSSTLTSHVSELGAKMDVLSVRVDGLTKSLEVVEADWQDRKASIVRLRKGVIGGVATVIVGTLTAAGTWAFSLIRGAM